MEFNIVSISRKANAVKTLIDAIEPENRRTGSCVDMTRVSITNGRISEREVLFLAIVEDPSKDDMEKMISGNGVMTFEVKPDMGELCQWRRNQKFFLCEPDLAMSLGCL
ncbi:hypothetical protein F2Q69_00001646 [Brassica cretica]|uniref:Uncharacterized protein n=1 Tax=Brassica cretica TaxID=69181 RepID=A0A8S9PL98_BRACR|nr:hypothetical protein F2Q69_00001646 [Brassica cretica]